MRGTLPTHISRDILLTFWVVWIKRGYGNLYYTLSVNCVNTDPITFKMLLQGQEASGSWVVQYKRYTSVTNFGFIRFCRSPMQRLLQMLDSFAFANHPCNGCRIHLLLWLGSPTHYNENCVLSTLSGHDMH